MPKTSKPFDMLTPQWPLDQWSSVWDQWTEAYYFDPLISKAFERWEKEGGKRWELIEPVDGFHPNQNRNALTSQIMFERYEELKILPPRNPNNKIQGKFGDQGGYH